MQSWGFIFKKISVFPNLIHFLLEVHSMLVSIMTNQLMLTGRSGMVESQLSTEVKYMAPYGLSFSARFSFTKRTTIYYIPKEARLNISHYLFWHPCNHLLHPQSLDFYLKTKKKKDTHIYFWARKVDIPKNNFGRWWRRRRYKLGGVPIGLIFSQWNPNWGSSKFLP